MLTVKLETSVYNPTKGIPWIARVWPTIHQDLLTGNLSPLGEAPLAVPSSRTVAFEPDPTAAQEEYPYTESDIQDIEATEKDIERQNLIGPGSSRATGSQQAPDKGKQRADMPRYRPTRDRETTPTRNTASRDTGKPTGKW